MPPSLAASGPASGRQPGLQQGLWTLGRCPVGSGCVGSLPEPRGHGQRRPEAAVAATLICKPRDPCGRQRSRVTRQETPWWPALEGELAEPSSWELVLHTFMSPLALPVPSSAPPCWGCGNLHLVPGPGEAPLGPLCTPARLRPHVFAASFTVSGGPRRTPLLKAWRAVPLDRRSPSQGGQRFPWGSGVAVTAGTDCYYFVELGVGPRACCLLGQDSATH